MRRPPRRAARLITGSAVLLVACSSSSAQAPDETPEVKAAPGDPLPNDGGIDPIECVPKLEQSVLRLAAGGFISSGADVSMCLRWTAPEDIDVTGFSGQLGTPVRRSRSFARSGTRTRANSVFPNRCARA